MKITVIKLLQKFLIGYYENFNNKDNYNLKFLQDFLLMMDKITRIFSLEYQNYIKEKCILRTVYRTLTHIFFHHTNLFNTLEEKFKICERLTLYCKKFNILKTKEFIIKL
jgi:hypothetical protein